jgi:hypothetical protein
MVDDLRGGYGIEKAGNARDVLGGRRLFDQQSNRVEVDVDCAFWHNVCSKKCSSLM